MSIAGDPHSHQSARRVTAGYDGRTHGDGIGELGVPVSFG